MKICPTCRKTYADDNLNFCLEDGSVLTFANDDPPATVMMSQPRPTDPSSAFAPNAGIQSSFGNQPQYQPAPKKSSKTWLIVVGILGVLLLLCGGGGLAGLIYFASQADIGANNNNSGDRFPGNSRNTPTPTATPANSSTETIDLSAWVKDFSAYGTTEMVGDEFMMAAKQSDYYYVLVAPDDYSTGDATTKVTVRNVENANSKLGYGLIFHSDPQPLTQDYAFLIDAKKRKYRVVRHEQPSKEIAIVPWTNSTTIKDGTQENVLEVRDLGSTIELYINNEKVTSFKDQYGVPTGVPGLYSGDGAKIGFKKLEITRSGSPGFDPKK